MSTEVDSFVKTRDYSDGEAMVAKVEFSEVVSISIFIYLKIAGWFSVELVGFGVAVGQRIILLSKSQT